MSNGGFDMARCAGGGSWPCGQRVLEKKLVGEESCTVNTEIVKFRP